jgi:flagellar biosynthesis protein FlhB
MSWQTAVLGNAYGELKIGKNGGKVLKSQELPRAVKLLLLLMMMITKIASGMTKLNNIFSCNVTP